jgi:hypothetical protein
MDGMLPYWEIPGLEEAGRAAKEGNIKQLVELVAQRPDFLDFDETVRKVWIAYVMGLQGSIASYEAFWRPYKGAGCPAALRMKIERASQEAKRARQDLLRIGHGLVQRAKWRSVGKNATATKNAIRDAYQRLLVFYQSIRQQANRVRRGWNNLSKSERAQIIQKATEESGVRAALANLTSVIPTPPENPIQHDPIYAVLKDHTEYQPWTEPSDLAWSALERLVGMGRATLKKWMRVKKPG